MINPEITLIFESSLARRDALRRNLTVLFGTRKGEQALDRNFGIDWSFLDQPLEVAKAMLSAEIITVTAAYVPAVTITSIEFTADADGNLTPVVSVEEVSNE